MIRVRRAVYPSEWHRIFGEQTDQSARIILPPLIDLFEAKSLVEIGCGHAHWSRAAQDHGVSDLLALDGPWNSSGELHIDRADFREVDLSEPLVLDRQFDMAICLEVAEHVAQEHAATLVSSITAAADIILFGAAIPLQGGHGHINEQWPSYWRKLFENEGYEPFDLVRRNHWSDKRIHYWYRQNSFAYIRKTNSAAVARAHSALAATDQTLMDAVHPEKFLEVASYDSIAFARLARKVPSRLANRIRQKLAGFG